MKTQELLQKIEDDPVSLSDEIREGSIPFDDVTKVIEKDIPPVIKISYLIHPDCTIEKFTKYYFYILEETKWQSRDTILTKAPIFKHLEVVAFVLNSKETSPEAFEKCYQNNKHTFKKLIKNPHISSEFKFIYYNLTGDSSYLPQDIQDCFIF